MDGKQRAKLRMEAMAMSPERLIEVFVAAATATDLAFKGGDSITQAQVQAVLDRSYVLADVIAERGGQETLARLSESETPPFVAMFAASSLYFAIPPDVAERYKDYVLTSLARVRDLNCGAASSYAETSWNKIVYRDPLGPEPTPDNESAM